MSADIQNLTSLGAELLIYATAAFFLIHALIVTFHWFNYGNSKTMSLTALAAYLTGGAPFLLIMVFAMLNF